MAQRRAPTRVGGYHAITPLQPAWRGARRNQASHGGRGGVKTSFRPQKRTCFVNAKHLTTYMKDHFAGSVAAVELLNHLISSHREKGHEQFFVRLRDEVSEDQEVLQGLLHDLGASDGRLRNATALLSEKLARIKLLLEDPSGDQLGRLEKLEALALGIEGKRALWRALLAVAEVIPAWHEVDFVRLDQRADDQRKRVEVRRIEAARQAFLSGKSD
jgi:hypothetical protein